LLLLPVLASRPSDVELHKRRLLPVSAEHKVPSVVSAGVLLAFLLSLTYKQVSDQVYLNKQVYLQQNEKKARAEGNSCHA
jgi:hypothetical protein